MEERRVVRGNRKREGGRGAGPGVAVGVPGDLRNCGDRQLAFFFLIRWDRYCWLTSRDARKRQLRGHQVPVQGDFQLETMGGVAVRLKGARRLFWSSASHLRVPIHFVGGGQQIR